MAVGEVIRSITTSRDTMPPAGVRDGGWLAGLRTTPGRLRAGVALSYFQQATDLMSTTVLPAAASLTTATLLVHRGSR